MLCCHKKSYSVPFPYGFSHLLGSPPYFSSLFIYKYVKSFATGLEQNCGLEWKKPPTTN